MRRGSAGRVRVCAIWRWRIGKCDPSSGILASPYGGYILRDVFPHIVSPIPVIALLMARPMHRSGGGA
jgi:hypothetical protein